MKAKAVVGTAPQRATQGEERNETSEEVTTRRRKGNPNNRVLQPI